ncbi:MAG TPA: MBL fold metallo-hydrolase [Vicinamibacterales bacterium]|nr:MBL fold metallo-hydrolase [Vicinamibacterales bacterium]
MRHAVALLSFLLIVPLTPRPAAQSGGDAMARARVQRAAAALGGEAKLRALAQVSLGGISVLYQREQSERPEGPWLPTFTEFSDVRDVTTSIVQRTSRTRGFVTEDDMAWSAESSALVADGLAFRASNGALSPAQTPWDLGELPADLGPEHVVVAALDARDLHGEADRQLHGSPHHVVAFTHKGATVRLILDQSSAMPKAIEITRARPFDVYWAPWGDVTQRVTFAAWLLEPEGIRFPRVWEYSTGGVVDGTVDITRVRLSAPPAAALGVSADALRAAVAARQRVADLPLGDTRRPPAELAPGIVKVPASWDIVEVKQDEGLVIIEAPLTSSYSQKVIDDAAKRFPGVPIKAVVTTSDSWPHIGGLREYVARGIPVYALDLNVPILRRLIAAKYETYPDGLARAPKPPIWRTVSSRTVLGTGVNRLELLPLRTITGERQMMVYLPALKLLYTSDLFTIRDQMVFLPAMVGEAVAAAARDHLDATRAFGMHYDVLPWQTVVDSATPKAYH